MILTDEFARQASMEQDLGIPSALFAAPVREVVELGKSQIGFMNMFAIPLFQGVTDIMPGMEFCVDELQRNKNTWEEKIAEEQAKARLDNDDGVMMDGMFSPRAMSLAIPSDASHQKTGSATSSTARSSNDFDLRIMAMLNKSPFSPRNGVLDEDDEHPHHHSLPELSAGPIAREESTHPSPNESIVDSSSRRSSKPSQLQLSYATSSAPDHPSLDPDAHELRNGLPNGIEVHQSLVTDPVIVDLPTPHEAKVQVIDKHEKQRSSDTTEGSNSAAGDWTSQATSATTGKMPISPSTQGTSIMSEDSGEKTGNGQTPTGGSPLASTESQTSTPTTTEAESVGTPEENDLKGMVIMEKVLSLKKRPSRFRMNSLNFWKRSKSASPPMPVSTKDGRRDGSEDDNGDTSHF
jgi:3',5'-cyclic-nucleotide phosphodiesterase